MVGLAAGPVAGAAVDRIGARRSLTISLGFMALGYDGLALVQEPWHAFAVSVLAGIGNAGFWPGQSSLLAGLTEGKGAERHAAYAVVVFAIGETLQGPVWGPLVADLSPPRLRGPTRRSRPAPGASAS